MIQKKQLIGISIIFFSLIAATFLGFSASFKMERDTQRNLDVSAIRDGLLLYYGDYGYFPASSVTGKIIACAGPDTKIKRDKADSPIYFKEGAKKPVLENLVECEWGESSLLDINDINYPMYLSRIPNDPRSKDGFSYIYVSNGENYQVFGSFEGKSQKEYDNKLKNLKLKCGSVICNFGKSGPNISLYEKLSLD